MQQSTCYSMLVDGIRFSVLPHFKRNIDGCWHKELSNIVAKIAEGHEK